MTMPATRTHGRRQDVGGHVDERRPHVEVVAAVAAAPGRRRRWRRWPRAATTTTIPPSTCAGWTRRTDALGDDGHGDHGQRAGIDQGGEDGAAVVAERAGVAAGPHRPADGEQRDDDGGHVGQVVAGVGEQAGRVGGEPGDDLADDQDDVDGQRHGQAGRPGHGGPTLRGHPTLPQSRAGRSPRPTWPARSAWTRARSSGWVTPMQRPSAAQHPERRGRQAAGRATGEDGADDLGQEHLGVLGGLERFGGLGHGGPEASAACPARSPTGSSRRARRRRAPRARARPWPRYRPSPAAQTWRRSSTDRASRRVDLADAAGDRARRRRPRCAAGSRRGRWRPVAGEVTGELGQRRPGRRGRRRWRPRTATFGSRWARAASTASTVPSGASWTAKRTSTAAGPGLLDVVADGRAGGRADDQDDRAEAGGQRVAGQQVDHRLRRPARPGPAASRRRSGGPARRPARPASAGLHGWWRWKG